MLEMGKLLGSVGVNCQNRPEDVTLVQRILNYYCAFIQAPPLRPDGHCGELTVAAIRRFQRHIVGKQHANGIITRAGPTSRRLCDPGSLRNAQKVQAVVVPPEKAPSSGVLQKSDFEAAAKRIGEGVDSLLVQAFAQVESGGKSGFGPDGLPVIAFEGHIFRKLTAAKYDVTNPMLSYPYKEKAGPEWKVNNADQTEAWKTLTAAAQLDNDAAMQSCSWGMFQVMGFNYKSCGYKTVDAFVAAMKGSEASQLDAFIGYCLSRKGMVTAMTDKDYVTMATLYNGADYGDYDQRIQKAYERLGGKS